MTLEEEEAAQIARIQDATKKAIQTTREYFAMKRSFLAAFPLDLSGLRNSPESPRPPAARAKTKELIKLVLDAIVAHPSDEFTFPQISAYLTGKGHELSRNQMRTVMEALAGKTPVFLKTPRSGSVAAIYSKFPVNGKDGAPGDGTRPIPSEFLHHRPMQHKTYGGEET